MEIGFIIMCLRCGEKHTVAPGRRNHRTEPIGFGTDNYGADHMACSCGNAVEERSGFTAGTPDSEFIVEWRDISK